MTKRSKTLKEAVRYHQVVADLSEFDAWLKEMEERASEQDESLVRSVLVPSTRGPSRTQQPTRHFATSMYVVI